MINNAIGVQRASWLGNGRAPRYDEIEFFWGPDDEKKKPTAWIIPNTQAADNWYWSSGRRSRGARTERATAFDSVSVSPHQAG